MTQEGHPDQGRIVWSWLNSSAIEPSRSILLYLRLTSTVSLLSATIGVVVPHQLRPRMLQRATNSQASTYLANKAKFNRLRRKSRLDFDKLYRLFLADFASSEIAKCAGLSRPRVNLIYKQYFSELFGMSDRERRERRENKVRQTKANNLARVIATDRVLTAVFKSAERAKRRMEPIFTDGVSIYHGATVTARCLSIAKTRTSASCLQRETILPLRHSLWGDNTVSQPAGIIEMGHILRRCPSYPRRVIRRKSAKLLKALFPYGGRSKNVSIPLDAKPNNPRYDFWADENNWG